MTTPKTLVRGRSLVDRAIQQIGQDIVSQRFPPDQGLPNEGEWCEQLGISRSVLREALQVLVSKNMISIRARAGGRIRDRAEWNQLDPDILIWRSHGDDQHVFAAELFELRRAIEPIAAGFAAKRILPEQLKALKEALFDMEATADIPELFLEPDERFHKTILGAVNNSLFKALSETIAVTLDLTLRMTLDAPKGQRRSLPMHHAVFEALASGDAIAAAAAMLSIIDAAEQDVADARNKIKKKMNSGLNKGPSTRK